MKVSKTFVDNSVTKMLIVSVLTHANLYLVIQVALQKSEDLEWQN